MAWPTDSWICRASCSAPRIRVVSPDGHCGALSSSRDSDADPGGLGLEVELLHELPPAGGVLAAGRRVGTALGLVLADRGGHDPAAALADVLVDAVTLAGDEPLLGVPELVLALGHVGAVLAHGPGRSDEQVALVGQRHRERVGGAVAGPRPHHGLAGQQGRLVATHERARRGDLRRPPPGVPYGAVAEVGDGEEAPPGADQGSDTDARAGVLGERLDLAVARGHGLVAPVHHPRVGVPRPGVDRRLDRGLGRVELAHVARP